MGKNQSASNLPNIIKQDANGSIAFMHGNTMLMQVSSSGAITTTGVISGSNALSASYAQTSSFANTLTVAGNLTAQTLVVQTITSSVDFVTGSTRFGSIIDNTHVFTGSMSVSGSTDIKDQLRIGGSTVISYDTNAETTRLGVGYAPQEYTKAIIIDNSTGHGLMVRQNNASGKIVEFSGPEGALGLMISGSGNVGIGTANPTYKLDVTGTGRFTGALTTSNISTSLTNGTVLIRDNGTAQVEVNIRHTSTRNGVLSFTENGVADRWAIGTKPSDGTLYFASGFDLTTPRLTLSSAGNVGIGVTNPVTAKLSMAVANSATNVGGLDITNGVNASFNVSLRTDITEISAGGTGNMAFSNSAERMRITSGGYLLLGTTTANYGQAGRGTFEMNGSTDNIFVMKVGGSLSSYLYSTAANTELYSTTRLDFATNGVERMRLTSAGNLGIGTQSPSAKLDVNGTINASSYLTVMGATTMYYVGNVAGNASFTINVTVSEQSSLRITAVMNHYGYIYDYGCARMSLVANGPVFTEINISNTTSANGGSWSFARVNNTTVSITKNAGSYGGGGLFFVEIVGHNPYGYNW